MSLDKLAKQVFKILRTFAYEVMLFNDDGNTVVEPEDARRFFAPKQNLLVSLVDDGDNSAVRVILSPDTQVSSVSQMLDTLRAVATKYNKLFRIKKSEEQITPRNFATKASVSEQRERTMKILEGLYGTSRSSYLRLENARMIVRHSSRINENDFGARGRNIESIHIENGRGERVLFPTTQLAPARAMTHHVNNGGSWADEIGAQINRMAADFAHLGAASRHIYTCGNELAESAGVVRENCREAIREMRRTFEGLCRKTRYAEVCEGLRAAAEQPLNEGAGEDLAESIAALAAMLNTNTVSLSEAVLTSVARILEGRKSAEDKMEIIGLLGDLLAATGLRHQPIKVNKAAWDELKDHNHLDLDPGFSLGTLGDARNKAAQLGTNADTKGMPSLVSKDFTTASTPKFTDPMARHCYVLTQIAEACRDASMGNLLAFIAEERPHLKGGEAAKKLGAVLDVIARKAFVAAKVDPNDLPLQGRASTDRPVGDFRHAGAVSREKEPNARALADWFDGFDADRLDEYDRFEEPDYDSMNRTETAIDSLLSDFDVNRFLDSEEASHLADLGDDVTEEEVHSALASYLENELANSHEVTGVDMTSAATHLMPVVISAYGNQPAMMMAAEDCGDGEDDAPILSKEDVLLPKDEGRDLYNEVTPATVRDPADGHEEAPDADYIGRLQSLAGVKRF